MTDTLEFCPVLDHLDRVAAPVAAALSGLDPADAATVQVAEIDPAAADTATFCTRYGVAPQASANCVVVKGRRDGADRHAACVVLATTRADVNGLVRRHLDVRKLSFAALDEAVALTGMQYGGITAIGLPPSWPVLVDPAVTMLTAVLMGSGLRSSKLLVPGRLLERLPGVQVLDGLGSG
jgi:prolyl-tRNA editing enzyme YbaK/EbsC (Cys-tRNA(Pro) deacylase)